ncbi:MAG: nuclear transport factor 2 family protein [Pseudomonadota bacterium]
MSDVEARIKVLEDREAIKELKARYCYIVDSRDWEAWSRLFTDDAEGEFLGFGTMSGREGFLQFAKRNIGPSLPFMVHMVCNPIIKISGDQASGRWYFNVPCQSSEKSGMFGGQAGWLQGLYDERYRRVDDEWLISYMKASFHFGASVVDGWTDNWHGTDSFINASK